MAAPSIVPYTVLAHHATKPLLVLAQGPALVVVNSETGNVVKQQQSDDPSKHQDLIRCLHTDQTGRYLVTSGEDKRIKCWDVDNDFALVNDREAEKRVVALTTSSDAQHIIAADKHGDVWSFKLADEKEPGTVIVGHVSMLTSMILSADNKYILTGDRDEKIRVSKYPKGYLISNFCLGHTQFLSQLALVPTAQELLVSGGGDDFLLVWHWRTGKQVQRLDLRAHALDLAEADKINVVAIRFAPRHGGIPSPLMAVAIERYPALFVFAWDSESRQLQYRHTIRTPSHPLDVAFDLNGRIWTALTGSAEDNALIAVYGQEDSTLEINALPSVHSDAKVDLYPTGKLRKDWLAGMEEREHEEADEEESGKRRKKAKK
ncbi:hypothetical protein RI367_006990 [Sorochytrium milnesiophthora]